MNIKEKDFLKALKLCRCNEMSVGPSSTVNINNGKLTDECDRLREKLGQVLTPVVSDGNSFVAESGVVFERVG